VRLETRLGYGADQFALSLQPIIKVISMGAALVFTEPVRPSLDYVISRRRPAVARQE
jgi:hypothetical protein